MASLEGWKGVKGFMFVSVHSAAGPSRPFKGTLGALWSIAPLIPRLKTRLIYRSTRVSA